MCTGECSRFLWSSSAQISYAPMIRHGNLARNLVYNTRGAVPRSRCYEWGACEWGTNSSRPFVAKQPEPPPNKVFFVFDDLCRTYRKRSRNASDGENRWDRIRAKFKLLLRKMRRDTHFLQVTTAGRDSYSIGIAVGASLHQRGQ